MVDPTNEESAAPTPPPARKLPAWTRVAGAYGVAALLGTFFLLTHEGLEPQVLYLGLNGTGALGLGLFTWKKRAWISLVLCVAWAAIAASGLWRLLV